MESEYEIYKKIPQENIEITEEFLQNGWKVLKEPSSLGITIVATIPISVILIMLTVFYLMILFPEKMNILDADGFYVELTINGKLLLYGIGILIYSF